MEKTYIYKVYDGSTYSGILDNVINEFQITKEINSAASQIQIQVAVSIEDAQPTLDTDELVDESGINVVDENNQDILTRSDYTLLSLPNLNDRIEVWEVSDYHPTGKLMFNGLVLNWSGNYTDDTVTITVVSYGIQLDNYLVSILSQDILQQNPTVDDSSSLEAPSVKGPFNRNTKVAQTFQLLGDSDVQTVSVYLGNLSGISVPCDVSIVEGTPSSPGSTLATVSRSIPYTGGAVSLDFTFTTTISLTGSTDYHILVEHTGSGTSTIVYGIDTTAAYSSGAKYLYNEATGWGSASNDMGFAITSATGSIGSQFLSTDPSDIMRELIDTFSALGGNLTYTDDSIDDTSTTVSYTFKFNTYMEAVKKTVELAPANWYWFVDPATGVLTMKQKGSVADHTLILGKHIDDLQIEYSLESLKNNIYFTGGDTGSGTNLQENYQNSSSIDQYGAWLDLPSDNRVTLTATAEAISEAILNEFSAPKFKVNVTIPDDVYDISSFEIGDMVGFGNFNSLINSLILQIMSISYTPHSVSLTLDLLPPTQSKRIEDIRRNLNKQQTENNPDVL